MDEQTRHSLTVCLGYLRAFAQHAVQYRQTSSYGPRSEGYEYVEVPLWAMRQMTRSIEAALDAPESSSGEIVP